VLLLRNEGVIEMFPSIADTFVAMTIQSPSESAAFLKDMRDKTATLVEKGIEADMLNPQAFQQALSKAIGSAADGVVNQNGEIDYHKLDQLMGGIAESKRQEFALADKMVNRLQNFNDSLFSIQL
jgi:hypothetical protein